MQLSELEKENQRTQTRKRLGSQQGDVTWVPPQKPPKDY